MKNLVKLYNKVEPSLIGEGLNWYKDANQFCKELSDKHSVPLDSVCAVLSALSPATNWEQNKKDTSAMLEGIPHAYTTYGANVSKAKRILKEGVTPIPFSMKTGPKTYNFYHNVLKPDNGEFVVVDRHAYRIATGQEYKGLKGNQYLTVADHYRKSAKKIGILPCELQAILWIDYRQNTLGLNFKKFKVPF